jgi:hypothetical protein
MVLCSMWLAFPGLFQVVKDQKEPDSFKVGFFSLLPSPSQHLLTALRPQIQHHMFYSQRQKGMDIVRSDGVQFWEGAKEKSEEL